MNDLYPQLLSTFTILAQICPSQKKARDERFTLANLLTIKFLGQNTIPFL